MERSIEENVGICSNEYRSYMDTVNCERRRLLQLVDDVGEFVSSTGNREMISQYKNKMAEVKQDLSIKCDWLRLTPFQRVVTQPGEQSTCLLISVLIMSTQADLLQYSEPFGNYPTGNISHQLQSPTN